MQRIASVFVGVLLLFFLLVVGTAVLSYGGLTKAIQEMDQHWAAIQKLQLTQVDTLKKLNADPTVPEGKPLLAETIKNGDALAALKIDPEHSPAFQGQLEDYKKAYNAYQAALLKWATTMEQKPGPALLELQGQIQQQNLERARYNQQVQLFNEKVANFPVSLVAKTLGFGPRPVL